MTTEQEHEEKGLEAMLTKLEVDSKGNLAAGFRNLGKVYFPDWGHVFPSVILGRVRNNDDSAQNQEARKKAQERYDDLKKKVKANEKLKDFEVPLKNKYWWIAQIECPISLKEELPDEFQRKDKDGHSKLGHYTERARWKLCCPGNYASLEERLVYGLKRQRQIDRQVDEFKNRLSEYKSGAQLTRVANDIEEIFDSYDGGNWNEIAGKMRETRSIEGIDSDIIEKRKEISDQIRITNERLGEGIELSYAKRRAGDREHSLRLEQKDWKYLEREWKDEQGKVIGKNPGIRTPSASELLEKKWMFLDIEIPHFKRKDGQITWTGATYIENGIAKKEIHTVHDLGVEEVDGCRIIKYANPTELVAGLTKRVKEENPDIVSAYNATFDFMKLRESEAEFLIGGDDSNPKYKSTAKNFARAVVDDRLLVDFMYLYGRMMMKHNPNAKLAMVSGEEKDISYKEMEVLEDKVIAGDKEAGITIAKYLAKDVVCLQNMHGWPVTKDALGVALRLSEYFNVELERLCHSASSINDVQNSGFFEAIGMDRDEIPQHKKTTYMEKLREEARDEFLDTVMERFIGKTGKTGLSRNVAKAGIPIGFFMRDLVMRRFPEASRLYSEARGFTDNNPILFLIEQYAREFSRWIIEDYGAHLKEVREFGAELNERGIPMPEFQGAYKEFREGIKKTSEESPNPARAEIQKAAKNALKSLNTTHLSGRASEENATPKLAELVRHHMLEYSEFAEFANKRSKVKRKGWHIIGNYAVYPRDFFEEEIDDARARGMKVMVIEEVLEEKFRKLREFFDSNGIKIAAREGSYVYTAGNNAALDSKESMVIKVDDIPSIYSADKIYYGKRGFIAHQKYSEDDPSNNETKWQMGLYTDIVEFLLDGKNNEARRLLEEAYLGLKTGQKVPEIADLIYKNRSKNMQSIFAENYDSGDGRLHFVEDERFIPEDECKEEKTFKNGNKKTIRVMKRRQTAQDERGLTYFMDTTGGAKPQEIRVYVGMPPYVKPDLEVYQKKISERGRAILEPVFPSLSLRRRKYADKDQLQFALA
jgi:hypothetical protein